MLKKTTYYSFVFLLCLPLIQLLTGFFNEKPLTGKFVKNEKTSFSLQGYSKGVFQSGFEKHIDQNIGLRGIFIRYYNQIQYSLFNTTNAEKVVIGKDGVLFEDSYIKSFFGQNLTTLSVVRQKLKRAEFISKELKKVGKELVIVIAPDKASYYPEKIPDSWLPKEIKASYLSNYKQYNKELVNYDLNYIDFNQLFINGKDTARAPMFPKSGIHWSNYHAIIAMDSLRKYFNTKLNIDLPLPYVENMKITENEPLNPDYDLGHLLNIVSKEYGKTIKGDLKFKNLQSKTTRILTIGDSFYWNLYYQGLMGNMFKSSEFWYYNHLVYPKSFETEVTKESINIRKKLQKVDVVMLLITSGAMNNFGFGFIDQTYQALQIKEEVYASVLQHFVEKIKSDEQWLSNIKSKASARGITTEEMLRLDSEYLMLQLSDEKLREIRIEILEKRILSSPDWLKNVKQKASEKGISLKDAIRIDAVYSVDLEDKQPILKPF